MIINNEYNFQDTIFAPITSVNGGSVCVFRVSGSKAKNLQSIFSKKFQHSVSKFTKILFQGQIIDEVLCTLFESPKSFTGEDVLEVSLHSSNYIIQKFTNILSSHFGFRYAKNGEFSYRALINGKINLLQAESINQLVKSETEKQHHLAIRGLSSNLNNLYQNWCNKLKNILSIIELNIDFSDQDISRETEISIHKDIEILNSEISSHLPNESFSEKIRHGIEIAIIGEPNVGKSSLINLFAKRNIAITSNLAGTTRDIIRADIDIDGILVNFFDTAGIRDSSDEIESIGIKIAIEKIHSADLRIFLIDSQNQNLTLYNKYKKENDILVVNKIDLNESKNIKNAIYISIKNLINIDKLYSEIKNKISLISPNVSELITTSERQYNLLKQASILLNQIEKNQDIEIISENIRITINYLNKINNFLSYEDVLSEIFSNFCIGK